MPADPIIWLVLRDKLIIIIIIISLIDGIRVNIVDQFWPVEISIVV